MTGADRWKRAEAVLDRLLDLPAEDREAELDALTVGDPALRADVVALLEEGERGGGLLDAPLERLIEGADEASEELVEARRTIGPWRILRVLGRGGMGQVYLAERADGDFDQRVALKIVRTGLDRREIVERFRHERRILARLRHPNIASLYDGGVADDGTPYFAMEVVEGERITDYADRNRLDLDARIRLFQSVCAAVAHAHRNLVVHRDLKPGNVLVTAEGIAKLLDFGIAKIVDPDSGDASQTTQRFLTPAYASPEQVRGQATTTATDVYSLGVLLYELLTGHHPHGETSRSAEVVRAILEDEPRDPSAIVTRDRGDTTAAEIARRRSTLPADLQRRLRGDLDNIVAKALRKDPAERYASVDDLREDLERYRGVLPVTARPATVGYRVRKFVRRNGIAVGAGAALLAGLIAFAISMSLLYARSEANRVRAQQAENAAAREAETAKRVSGFMTDLFRVSNPDAATWDSLTAREVLERAVKKIRTGLDDEPLVRAQLLGTLGEVHTGLGRYAEARRLQEEGLELQRSAPGDHPLEYAQALQSYAILLRKMGDYRGALDAYQRALSLREAALGPDHPDVAESLTGIGIVYNNLGLPDSSRISQERALAIKKKVFGPDDESVASSSYNLGVLNATRLDYAAARPYFEDAHRIWEARLGEHHARTLGALGAIALTMDRTGDPQGARDVERRVLAGKEAALGPSHPDLSFTLLHLATLEGQMGRAAEARAYAERALRICERSLGTAHPQVAAALGVLADLRSDAGESDTARVLARRGLAIFDAAKLSNLGTLEALERVGRLERKLGNESAARSAYTRARSLAVKLYGPDHAEVTAVDRLLEGDGRPASSR